MDPTEEARRILVAEAPAALAAYLEAGGQVWTTDQMRDVFEVEGFSAPFAVVKRRTDGALGSLQFATAQGTRFYFGWVRD